MPWLTPLLLIALSCFSTHAQQQSATPTTQDEPVSGSITGKVVNESGQPLAGVAVFVRAFGSSVGGRTTMSNTEGDFQINGLDPALYVVSASLPAYVTRARDPQTPAPTYRLGDSVRIELIRGGVITGTVTNAAGEPVVGVRVRAFMVRDVNNKPTNGRALAFGERPTDDRGIYRIYGLGAGSYLVQAGGGGNLYSSMNPYDFDAPTFSPSSNRDTAAEIQVRSGDESNADIRYRGEPGHIVSGTVRLNGATGASVSLTRAGDGVLPAGNSYQQPGARGFSIYGVGDGDYDLVAQEMVSSTSVAFPDLAMSDPLRLTVKGADITGLELITKPLASISGRILLEPSKIPECQGKRRPAFAEAMIEANPNRGGADQEQSAYSVASTNSASPDAEGNFRIRNVRPAQYAFSPRFFARYWYLQSMSIGSSPTASVKTKTSSATAKVDAARNWTTVKSGDRITRLTITLAEGAASLRGKVVTAEGSKLPVGLLLYLVPAEREKADDALRFFVSQVAPDGTLSLYNLPPGNYWSVIRTASENEPTTTAKLRLPDQAEFRAKLRRNAEAAKLTVELKPCQNLSDYQLPFMQR